MAKVGESTAQRVQKSVFECQVPMAEFETLEHRLLCEIERTADCLRRYRLPDTRGTEMREHGEFKAVDFEGPPVLQVQRLTPTLLREPEEPPWHLDRFAPLASARGHSKI